MTVNLNLANNIFSILAKSDFRNKGKLERAFEHSTNHLQNILSNDELPNIDKAKDLVAHIKEEIKGKSPELASQIIDDFKDQINAVTENNNNFELSRLVDKELKANNLTAEEFVGQAPPSKQESVKDVWANIALDSQGMRLIANREGVEDALGNLAEDNQKITENDDLNEYFDNLGTDKKSRITNFNKIAKYHDLGFELNESGEVNRTSGAKETNTTETISKTEKTEITREVHKTDGQSKINYKVSEKFEGMVSKNAEQLRGIMDKINNNPLSELDTEEQELLSKVTNQFFEDNDGNADFSVNSDRNVVVALNKSLQKNGVENANLTEGQTLAFVVNSEEMTNKTEQKYVDQINDPNSKVGQELKTELKAALKADGEGLVVDKDSKLYTMLKDLDNESGDARGSLKVVMANIKDEKLKGATVELSYPSATTEITIGSKKHEVLKTQYDNVFIAPDGKMKLAKINDKYVKVHENDNGELYYKKGDDSIYLKDDGNKINAKDLDTVREAAIHVSHDDDKVMKNAIEENEAAAKSEVAKARANGDHELAKEIETVIKEADKDKKKSGNNMQMILGIATLVVGLIKHISSTRAVAHASRTSSSYGGAGGRGGAYPPGYPGRPGNMRAGAHTSLIDAYRQGYNDMMTSWNQGSPVRARTMGMRRAGTHAINQKLGAWG